MNQIAQNTDLPNDFSDVAGSVWTADQRYVLVPSAPKPDNDNESPLINSLGQTVNENGIALDSLGDPMCGGCKGMYGCTCRGEDADHEDNDFPVDDYAPNAVISPDFQVSASFTVAPMVDSVITADTPLQASFYNAQEVEAVMNFGEIPQGNDFGNALPYGQGLLAEAENIEATYGNLLAHDNPEHDNADAELATNNDGVGEGPSAGNSLG